MIRKKITLNTQQKTQFYNVTKKVQDLVDENKVTEGLVTIRSLHTTSAVYINEDEEGLKKDLVKYLSKIFPEGDFYHHDDFSKRLPEPEDNYKHRKNGFAHLRAMFLGHDVTVPIIGGKLSLGRWQSIFFVELEGPRVGREMEIIIFSEG